MADVRSETDVPLASPAAAAAPASSTAPSDAGSAAPSPAAVRIGSALTLVGCLAILGLAAYVHPDPRGFGTHQQLGAGPCAMLIKTGFPCPTCGMTTAFAHTVRGQWLQAMWVQPAGFVLALCTIAAVVVSAWSLIRGRWPQLPFWITPYRFFFSLLVLLLGAWAFRIAVGLAEHTLPYR